MTNNREPERRKIQTNDDRDVVNLGNYFELVVPFFMNFFGDRRQTPGERHPTQQKLLNQIIQEVAARLHHSLHNRIYILLDQEEDISQVNPPWAIDVKVGIQAPKRLPSNKTITDIFDRDDISGRLLILGAPGSGKTTTSLQLAQVLINRAQNDINQSIPVLLNLSSWKDDKQSIKDWIVDDLDQKYGVRKDIGKKWLKKAVIIPLLDGLDEVSPARQGLCVEKINEFLTSSIWSSPLVVCSRSEEYQLLSCQDKSQSQIKKLELNGAVILQHLTKEQIQDYFHRVREEYLWENIHDDENLMELAKTPLLLNIIVISYIKISLLEWQKLSNSKQRLSYLFNAYIKRMIERDYKKKRLKPEDNKTIRWLKWLAVKLNQSDQTELLLEKIQPDWLNNQKTRLTYMLIVGLVAGLVAGMLFGLINGIIYGLINETINGIINGIIYGAIAGIIYGIIYGIIGWIIFLLGIGTKIRIIGLSIGILIGIIVGLCYGIIYGLIGGTIAGLSVGMQRDGFTFRIEAIETLNLSVNKFLINLICGLILVLIPAIISLLIVRLNENPMIGMTEGLFYALINGLFVGLTEGLEKGLDRSEIEVKNLANQGIKNSLNNILVVSLTISPLIVLFYILTTLGITQSFESIEVQTIWYKVLIVTTLLSILIGVYTSGIPALQHFILRFILWSNGYIPWNYANFLDYTTDKLFTQRVGGGYRFIHRLLQEHFADI